MRASPLSSSARQGLPRWWLPALWLLLCACLLSLASGASAQSLTSLAGLGGSSSSSSSSDEERAIQAQREATTTAEQEADALAQSLERLRSRVQTPAGTAPAPLSDQELGQIQARWEERVPANASQEVLEKLLTDEREAIAALKSGIEKSAAEQANLVAQPGNGRTDLATLQQRVQETATPVTAEPGESTALTQARQLRRNAENRRARQELALRQEEQSTIETRQRLLDVQLQTQRRELLERTPRVAWLNQRIADRARQQLEQQVQQTQAAESDVAEAPAAVRDVAQQNTALAEQILAHNDRLVQERQALASDEYRQSQLASALRDTQARLRLGGSASVGQWLWKQRVALPTVNTLQARRKATLRQLAELRLALFNASERRFDLNGTAAVGGSGSAARTPRGGVQNTALWTKQAALIDQLQPLLLRRIAVLEQTDAALQSTLKSGSALRQVMDKELLWFPSHLAMGGGWLDEWRTVLRSADPAGLEPSANASPWNTARVLGASILRNLWIYAGIFAGVLLLLGLRRYALQKLQAIAEQVDNFSQDHFGLTLMALGWSLLYALPWSFATAALGVLLQSAAAPVALEPLGQALEQLSAFVFVVTLLNVLFRPCGLAVAHFGWPRERVQVLRQMVLRATWLIVPIDLLGGLAFYSHDDSAISTWGRMCLLVLTLGLAWMAFRYLRQSVLKQRPGLRWSQVVSVAALLVLAVTLVGIVLGYVYTATEVIQALLSSFVFLAAAEVLVSLLRRWLLLGERRLALNRLRAAALQRQAANAAAAADAGTGTTSNANTNASDEQSQMALVTVSTQAHRLLGLLQRVLVALSLVYAWSPVLPALLRFEGVVLWYTTNTDASGIARPAPVSLMDLLIGALILLMTFSLTRNLPGLVEVVFSSTRRVSSSDRYTMATLARYGITIAGTVSALSLLGLRWSQLQWMAAALTVGLGFGLQEIFANFVSGLILLVERPFRVGDVITINQHTGTVTRIRTRATTVLDFDNQEIVIPNKTFITGQVTNWTLSDDVTRLIIDVSVAHGSDPAEVQRMLLAIAAEHPKVLREPEANCWFMALEGQGQKFELRVYVGAVDDRLPVRNDLNRSINARLKAAGIAVAFPQMDIHVRDLPPAAAQEAQGA